jgi:hypothetical protein
MRSATLLLLAALLATPALADDGPGWDSYADGRGFAAESLENLLRRDSGDDAVEADPVDPNGPTDCMLRIDGATSAA